MGVVLKGERGAREAVQTMDWGIVIDEGFQDDVSTVFLIGQGGAHDPPDAEERATAARKLRAIADVLAPVEHHDGDRVDAALKVLGEYVTLPYPGRRLVEDAGSPERVRADERNRAMMRRVLLAADVAGEEKG